MKIAVTSDIHLEFGYWSPVNPENADVLILSGDIMVANDVEKALGDPHKIINGKGHEFIDFLVECKQNYPHVVYVMGNHEHYHGDFATSAKVLRKVCDDVGIHFLNKDCVTIDDVTFIGDTLWTDMNKGDELTLYHIASMMNDFRIVKNSNKMVSYKSYLPNPEPPHDSIVTFKERPATFKPEDAVEEHKKFLDYLRTMIEGKFDQKFVVVGHHAPSKLSTKPQYEDDVLMNGGYSSDLSEFILDHPQIRVWTHGHTHHEFDYMIGSTRIVCNPRGYVNYERNNNNIDPYFAKVIEV